MLVADPYTTNRFGELGHKLGDGTEFSVRPALHGFLTANRSPLSRKEAQRHVKAGNSDIHFSHC